LNKRNCELFILTLSWFCDIMHSMSNIIHIFFLLLFYLSCTNIHADIDVKDSGIEDSKHTFSLKHLEDGLSLRVNLSLEGMDIAFKKEPDFGDREIIKGALPTGRKKKDHLCFAVDSSAEKMYLDLNRNLDLLMRA